MRVDHADQLPALLRVWLKRELEVSSLVGPTEEGGTAFFLCVAAGHAAKAGNGDETLGGRRQGIYSVRSCSNVAESRRNWDVAISH